MCYEYIAFIFLDILKEAYFDNLFQLARPQIFCVVPMIMKPASIQNLFAITHGIVKMEKTKNIVFMKELTNTVMENNGNVKTKKNASTRRTFVTEKMIVLMEVMKCRCNVVSVKLYRIKTR